MTKWHLSKHKTGSVIILRFSTMCSKNSGAGHWTISSVNLSNSYLHKKLFQCSILTHTNGLTLFLHSYDRAATLLSWQATTLTTKIPLLTGVTTVSQLPK